MGSRLTIDASAYITLCCYLLLMPLRWVFSVLIAMTVHELGHCIAIWALGGKVYQIRLSVCGAKIETQLLNDRQTLVCALAGPAAGLLLCLFYRWIPQIALPALLQSVFNLIPVYPFDGGRALKVLIGRYQDKAVAKSSASVYNDTN